MGKAPKEETLQDICAVIGNTESKSNERVSNFPNTVDSVEHEVTP